MSHFTPSGFSLCVAWSRSKLASFFSRFPLDRATSLAGKFSFPKHGVFAQSKATKDAFFHPKRHFVMTCVQCLSEQPLAIPRVKQGLYQHLLDSKHASLNIQYPLPRLSARNRLAESVASIFAWNSSTDFDQEE